MAIIDLFINRRPKLLTTLGVLQLDCSLTETHVVGHRMSPYPIADGPDLFDHFQQAPERLTINAVVSETPLLSFAGIGGKSSTASWLELVALHESKLPFTIYTSLRTYTNMVFDDGDSLQAQRDERYYSALNVTMNLVKYRVAYTTLGEAVAAEVADLANQGAADGAQGSIPAEAGTAAAAAGAP